MIHDEQLLDKYLIRCLNRLSENDSFQAIKLLSQHIDDLRNADYYLSITIADLPLSRKASNLLYNHSIENVRELLEYDWNDLARVRGFGPHTINELKTLMEKLIAKKDTIRGKTGCDLLNTLLSPEKIG